jgi:3-hydroxymyristoyl/3-hydroxydecanoyl-(acyl carrier protein) dehydratase
MRYVLLDRITELAPPERAKAVKCVSLSDDVFADHFPGLPIFPGALVLEALAELGGVLLEATLRERGRRDLFAVLSIVERMKLRRMVRPGDRIDLEARGIVAQEIGGRVRALAHVDGQLVTETEITFSLVQITNPKVIEQRMELLDVWLYGGVREPGAEASGIKVPAVRAPDASPDGGGSVRQG